MDIKTEETHLLNQFSDYCNDEQIHIHGEKKHGRISTIFNVVSLMVGVGMLGLPQAMDETGWVFGFISLILAGFLSFYCGLLLQRCILEGKVIRSKCETQQEVEDDVNESMVKTYPELGFVAAGFWGKQFAVFGAYGTSVGSAILMIVLASDQFKVVFGDDLLPSYLWSIIFVAVLLPFAYIKTLGHVAFVSVFGAIASVIIFTVVVTVSLQELVQGTNNRIAGDCFTTSFWPESFGSLAKGYVTIAFSFGGACAFPEIMRGMRVPVKFQNILAISISIAAVIYSGIAGVGYGVYGHCVSSKSSIINLLPAQWPSTLIAVCILIHLLSAFLILLNPVFREIEVCLKIDHLGHKSGIHVKELALRIINRTSLIFICLIIACVIPFFSDVMGLIGATTITLSSFVCPCWYYLAIFTPDHKKFWRKNRQPSSSTVEYSVIETENEESEKVCNTLSSKTKITNIAEIPFPAKRRQLGNLEMILIWTVLLFSTLVGVIALYQAIFSVVRMFTVKHIHFFT